MKCRLAKKSDLLVLKELWYECFLEHDSKASIDYYFDNAFVLDTTFVLEVGNEIVTSLQLNQHDIVYNSKVESVSFVVGVATFNKHRKKGYMKVLLNYVIEYARKNYQQNYMILQAYDWNIYRPFNFKEAYYKKSVELSIADLSGINLIELIDYSSLSMLSIYQKYTENLNGYKKRDKAYFDEMKKMLEIDEMKIALSNEAYLYYQVEDNTLMISECAYNSWESVLQIIKTLNEKMQFEKINVMVDTNNNLEGRKELFMMIRELNDKKFKIDEKLYISEFI
ncbi:putative acetyltransferase [Bacilli bacterium PM5-3]|nr:putative acetyltransferase [Bacilli bacterium PM5-3]